MTLPSSLAQRLRWLNLPAVLLVALLQRTPVVQMAAKAETLLTPPGVAAILRSALAATVTLGPYHALAGATQFVLSRPSPIAETVGQAITPVFFTYTGTPAPPASFRITGSLAPGLSFLPPATAAGIVNSSTPRITGTPTAPGTFQIQVQGYNNVNGTGETNNEQVPIVFNVSGLATPVFTLQPASQSVNAGADVKFVAAVAGTPPPAFQWRRNGVNIAGATTESLTLLNVQAADAGDYSVLAGTVVSDTATLTVTKTDSTARLTNLSVRTAMASGQLLIVGVVVSDGSREVLVRAAGPALATFGISTPMADPRLELYNGPDMVLSNNDWAASLASTFVSVGAFPFASGSKDAAFMRGIIGAHSIQAQGTGAGVVLVEAYDVGAPTAARLVNVSARNRVGRDADILIAGFTISGPGSKPLLIRAVGPKLATFGVVGFLADPKLEIYNSGNARIAENDNWDASLAATSAAAGAFALDGGSRDAALVVTLPPGGYTAQVRGADNGTGEALIEIYEIR